MNHYQRCEEYHISYKELSEILLTQDNTLLRPYIPLLNDLNYQVEYLPHLNNQNAFALMCEGWHLAIHERDDMNLLLSSINQYYDDQQHKRPILWHTAMLNWTFFMIQSFWNESRAFGGIFSTLIVKRDLEKYTQEPWLHDARQFFKEVLQKDSTHPTTLRAIYRASHLPTPFFSDIIPDTWTMFLEGHTTEDAFIAQYQADHTLSETSLLL